MPKICYTYKPDGTYSAEGWEGPNTITFKVIEGEYQPSIICPFDPQITQGNSEIVMALQAVNGEVDGWLVGQLLYAAAANAFQAEQWPSGILKWVPEESEMQIQVDGEKVATFDLVTGDITPVE